MTLSKRGDYVMKSAIYLARAWIQADQERGKGFSKNAAQRKTSLLVYFSFLNVLFEQATFRKVRQIVDDTLIPNTFAPQILADLVRSGLVISRAGREGGYRLSKDPSSISALEVVESAEGLLRADRCALGQGPCRWDDVCPLHETWTAATQAIGKVLQATTLKELAERDIAIEGGNYKYIPDAHRSHPVAIDVNDRVQVELGSEKLRKNLTSLSSTAELDALLDGAYRFVVSPVEQTKSRAPLPGSLINSKDGTKKGIFSETKNFFTLSGTERDTSKKRLAKQRASVAIQQSGQNEVVSFLWRGDNNSPISSIEANLEILELDDDRTELVFKASMRQGHLAELLLKNHFEELSRKFVRQFLKQLARHMEEADSSV